MASYAFRRWLPALDYDVPLTGGYWTPETSTINWCEEDYYVTRYVAEIVNTLTNVLFFYLGIRGLRNCIQQGHDRVFLLAFIGYLLTGIGSFLFHATLKYHMQLLDELSMIYTTCIMCHAIVTFRMTRTMQRVLALLLAGLSAFITLYYYHYKDPTFHQGAYALLSAIVIFRSIYVMEVNLRPSLCKRNSVTPQTSTPDTNDQTSNTLARQLKNLEVLKTMWWLVGLGLSITLGAFTLWTMDNKFCSNLRLWQRSIGLPWGILLEGHGWWHLMTGIGAYFFLVWGIWLRYCLIDQQDNVECVWPSKLFSLPDIVAVKPQARMTDRKPIEKAMISPVGYRFPKIE